MNVTTPGAMMISAALPEDLRQELYDLDKKGVQALLQRVAERYPDRYNEVADKLMKIGQLAVETTGNSLSLASIDMPLRTRATLGKLRAQVDDISDDDTLSEKKKSEKIIKLVGSQLESIQKELFDGALADGNPLAIQAQSGSRGNATSFRQIIAGDGLVSDHLDRIMPIPILNGYSQGLDPVEYMAASFGSRKGSFLTKKSVADAGFMAKEMSQATHRQMVTMDDCGTRGGITVPGSDKDSVGSVLAQGAAGYKAGSIITPEMYKKLRDLPELTVRSTITCSAPEGICSRCAGVRDRGTLPRIGDAVGLMSAQSVGETLSQGMLSSKHCLSSDTLIRMADGTTKPIQSVQVGDMVLGADEAAQCSPVRVTDVFENGVKDVWRHSFRRYRSRGCSDPYVDATVDHKALLANAIGRIAEFNLGEFHGTPLGEAGRNTFTLFQGERPTFGEVHEEGALLVGLMLGDGCYTERSHSPDFACFDQELLDHLTPYLEGLNLKLARTGKYNFHLVRAQGERTVRDNLGRMTVTNPFTQLRDRLGMNEAHAWHKRIPGAVFTTWDKESICALIAGLFASDGWVARRSLTDFGLGFGTSSQVMAEQLSLLLTELGIGHVTSQQKTQYTHKGERKRGRDVHKIDINRAHAVRRFAALIPVPGVKGRHLRELLPGLSSSRDAFAGRHQLGRFIEAVLLGSMPTYDIQVDHPSHMFVLANGLIVSNSGGTVSAKGPSAGGFKAINAAVQFTDSEAVAPVSPVDGVISKIEPAPQGGHYVFIGDEKTYSPPDHTITVKKGDTVEAGDTLTNGVPNSAEVVRLKGIGEGRMYLMKHLQEVLSNSGVKPHRRNLESVVRGLVNHVRITPVDGYDGLMVDDVVPFDRVMSGWEPREGFLKAPLASASGMYLEEPALHYTVGTRVTPKVAQRLRTGGITDVSVHKDPPPFEPEPVRVMESAMHDEDWMTRLSGSFLQKGFNESVLRGRTSNPRGTSYVPALAQGTDFGKDLPTKGTY